MKRMRAGVGVPRPFVLGRPSPRSRLEVHTMATYLASASVEREPLPDSLTQYSWILLRSPADPKKMMSETLNQHSWV